MAILLPKKEPKLLQPDTFLEFKIYQKCFCGRVLPGTLLGDLTVLPILQIWSHFMAGNEIIRKGRQRKRVGQKGREWPQNGAVDPPLLLGHPA